jgi:hypothetical protein
MKTVWKLALGAVLLSGTVLSGSAATYSGNGNSGFGGPIGLGSLTLTDNGTTVSGTVNKGPNGFNDVLVIYIDSQAGGFSNTAGFADGADGFRRAISGFDGGGNRSVLTFAGGFFPDYAFALGPASGNFGGLWQLANGGTNSLNFVASVNLNPTGNNNSPTYTFSFNVSQSGITPNSGATFKLFATYVSNDGFRSDEAVAGNDAGAQGWNPFMQTAFTTYQITFGPLIPPTITGQPQSQTVNPGSNATFCVTASGAAPLSYQWRFNGTNISATNSCYTRTNAQLAHAGNYTVVVTNFFAASTSAVATLSVTPLRLDWFTIDGGGHTSTNNALTVSGTIGQPDAGKLNGGLLAIAGGFWGVITAVQTPGAPTLKATSAAPGLASLSWIPNTPGYLLQETAILFPANWTNSPSGATNPIVVPTTLPKKFYRLFKP